LCASEQKFKVNKTHLLDSEKMFTDRWTWSI